MPGCLMEGPLGFLHVAQNLYGSPNGLQNLSRLLGIAFTCWIIWASLAAELEI